MFRIKAHNLKRFFIQLTALKFVIYVGIVLLVFFFLVPHYFQLKPDPTAAASLLVSYSELLTTIFAITISVTLIAVQYLAETYTPRSVTGYFNDSFFAGFIFLYVFSISLDLSVASFPQTFQPSIFVWGSLVLLLFCLVYLVAYPFHVISKLQPARALERIDARIPSNFFQIITQAPYWSGNITDSNKEPFIILEQMIIRSIRDNDYDLYIQCLNFLVKTSNNLIDKAKKEYADKKDLKLLAKRTDSIVDFIYRPLDQIKIEIFHTRNEFFILSLLYRAEKLVGELHEAEAIRSLRNMYDLYDGIGIFAVKNDLELIAEEYCRSVNRIIKVEMKVNEFELSPFEEKPIDWNKLSEEQKTERSFNQGIFEMYFTIHRLDSLKEIAKVASEKGFKFAVYMTMTTYSEIFDTIIEFKNANLRGYLYQIVMWSLNEAYENVANQGIHESQAILGMLQYKIERMQKLGLPLAEKEYLTKSFCALALLDIKKDDDGARLNMGIQGRVMARKNEPSLAIIIAETLGEALKTVHSSNSFKHITEKQVRIELESIKNFDKSGDPQVSKKVDELLSST
jgi:hypothetical protein